MDLLNSQFLDKMNNNIGRLHYEGWFAIVCLHVMCCVFNFLVEVTCCYFSNNLHIFVFVCD